MDYIKKMMLRYAVIVTVLYMAIGLFGCINKEQKTEQPDLKQNTIIGNDSVKSDFEESDPTPPPPEEPQP